MLTNEMGLKEVQSGEEARSKVIKGIDILADAVASTLGAAGSTVLVEDEFGKPHITKDGVSVANYINLADPCESLGAELVKDAARKTVKDAGDGTTTSTVLTRAVIKEGLAQIENGATKRSVIDSIKADTAKVVKLLKQESTEVSESNLRQIAIISANGDEAIGDLIADAYKLVGKDGTVAKDTSDTAETYIVHEDGSVLDNRPLKMPQFATDKDKGIFEEDNVRLLLAHQKIQSVNQIRHVLEYCVMNGRTLMIVGECEPPVLSTLATNAMKGNLKINVIDPPMHGKLRFEMMEDLSKLSGATIIGQDVGNAFDVITHEDLGYIDTVVTDHQQTLMTFSDDIDVSDRVKELHDLIDTLDDSQRIGEVKMRINFLTGKVAKIKIGAKTEVELREKRDRIDDAIQAVKAAIKEGYLPGAGVALRDVSHKISDGVIKRAILAPYNTILKNADLSVNGVAPKGKGVDVVTGKVVSMKRSGIIDPTKVTTSALQNAASVAATVLSTDSVITNKREYESV